MGSGFRALGVQGEGLMGSGSRGRSKLLSSEVMMASRFLDVWFMDAILHDANYLNLRKYSITVHLGLYSTLLSTVSAEVFRILGSRLRDASCIKTFFIAGITRSISDFGSRDEKEGESP